MSALERDGDKPFSLEKVRILLLDGEATSMSILGQILSGFGARSLRWDALGRLIEVRAGERSIARAINFGATHVCYGSSISSLRIQY